MAINWDIHGYTAIFRHTQVLGFREIKQVQPATTPPWSSMPIHVWNLWRLGSSGGIPDRLASIQLMVHWWFQTYLFLMFRKHIIYIYEYIWNDDQLMRDILRVIMINAFVIQQMVPRFRPLPSCLPAPLTLPTGSISRKKWDYNFNMSFSEPIWAFNHWDLNIKYLHRGLANWC